MLAATIKKQFASPGSPGTTLDVSLTAGAGVTVLFGPSGAGKTTILRAIAGIVAPDAGRITLGDRVFFDSGRRINRPIQQRHVGYVFQESALFPHLTAEQNVAYGAPDRACARGLMAALHIEQAAARYPRELSGGEQQRVGLARALAAAPEIVLLDEPVSAVDVATRTKLLDEITALQRNAGVPFLYVTHNHAEAVRVGDQLYVLDRGRILQAGKPLEVFNAPQTLLAARIVGTENIFIGTVAAHQADAGLSRIDLGGCRIEAAYNGLALGTTVTIGLRSEDIIVARERLTRTSARNVLAGTITRIIREPEKTELIVGCGVDFKVSVTAGSIRDLGLAEGTPVYLLMKARAFHLLT
ncbi:ABC transporter ATP-binding protein [bacterium]|nr:ABC transporter ATP-binding protein [bacterium]